MPCAKVQRIDEVVADPQVQARGMLIEQDHPFLGRITMPNLPFRFSGCDLPTPAVAFSCCGFEAGGPSPGNANHTAVSASTAARAATILVFVVMAPFTLFKAHLLRD